MKILIISQYYFPDITAAANRIAETADLLCDTGHDVTVVTATPHKSNISEHDVYDESAVPSILRVNVDVGSQRGVWGLIGQYFGFSLGALLKIVRNIRSISPDVIWISSPPLPVTISSLALKFFFRVPVVLDIRDIWPESAVNIDKIKRGSLLEKFGKKLEQLSYDHAAEITCVSSPMKKYLDERTSNKVTIIYNSVGTLQMKKLYNGSPDADIFCYAGNVGHAQDMEILVRSFSLAREHPVMSSSVLHIVGAGAVLDDVKILVAELNLLDWVNFFGPLPKDEALDKMHEAGCLLLPLKDAPAFRITVPSKVFDYMSMARPILTNMSGEGAVIVGRCEANEIVPPGDIERFAKAMIKIRNEWEFRFSLAATNKDIIANEFTREYQVRELDKVLSRCVNRV